MPEATYRIKPLVWVKDLRGETATIPMTGELVRIYTVAEKAYLCVFGNAVDAMDSIEAAKTAAEQWYRKKIAEALEEAADA